MNLLGRELESSPGRGGAEFVCDARDSYSWVSKDVLKRRSFFSKDSVSELYDFQHLNGIEPKEE